LCPTMIHGKTRGERRKELDSEGTKNVSTDS
jgi:hypothetical protein